MRVATLFVVVCVAFAASVQVAVAEVYEKIFGYDYIGHGFDAVTGENTLLPVVELSYDLEMTWRNPLVPDQVMMIPDQVGVLDLPVGMGKNTSNVFTDVYDYTEEYMHTKKKSSWGGFKKKSTTTYHFMRQYFVEDQSMTATYQEVTWFQLQLLPLPVPQMNSRIQSMVDALPEQYNPDPNSEEYKAYRYFLTAVGTHYYTTTSMGGWVEGQTWFHKCIFQQYNVDWVKKQSGWSFFGIVGSSSGSYDEKDLTSDLFRENSQTSCSLQGGDPMLVDMDPSRWTDWVHSIHTNMIPVRSEHAKISELITNQAKRANMEQAMEDYGSEALLEFKNQEADYEVEDPFPDCSDWDPRV